MGALRYFFLSFAVFLPAICAFSQGSLPQLIGQGTSNRTITTAVPFLNLTVDARAAGMGDAGVATSPDANSAYWNAAKLAFVEKDNGVSLSYTPWLAKMVNDMFVVYLSGFYKIKKVQTISTSMRYFNIGEMSFNKGPDINDELGDFNPREFAFDFTYSRILSKHLSIGGAIRYIHSNLTGSITLGGGNDGKPGNSVAVDVGVFFSKPSKSKQSILSFGASINNVGAKISYSNSDDADFIPTNLRLGGAYSRYLTPLHLLTFAMDINKLLVPSPAPGSRNRNLLEGIFGSFGDAEGGFEEEMQEITLSTGLEYWYNETFSGRIGYFLESDQKGGRKYLTLGVGARISRFGFDLAYMQPTNGREHALSETVRFTLTAHFNSRKDKEKTAEEEAKP